MESWIQLYRFWNPVLPVQVSDSVLTGIGWYRYRPSKIYEYQYRPLYWYRCISTCRMLHVPLPVACCRTNSTNSTNWPVGNTIAEKTVATAAYVEEKEASLVGNEIIYWQHYYKNRIYG